MAKHQRPPRDTPILRVGCSGWQYRHWRGEFYPEGVPTSRWLEYYATQFDTVEINNSFYRLQAPHAFDEWHRRAPDGFLYAVKASRYITHMKKLKDPEGPLDLFFSRATHLSDKLGPILYQLPPRWPLNLDRLTGFLRALPGGFTHVMEFRDPTWYVDDVFDALHKNRVSLCLHDMEGSATGLRRAGPAIYVRFHGPARYRGRYPDDRLEATAVWCRDHLSQGVPVYAYFNNDIGGHAPRDAIRFRQLLSA